MYAHFAKTLTAGLVSTLSSMTLTAAGGVPAHSASVPHIAAPAPALAAAPAAAPLAAPAAPPPLAQRLVADARALVGKPYSWGATGPRAFDCSGFTQYVYSRVGVHLERTTWQQAQQGRRVSVGDIRPGDLVLYYRGKTHVGIYVGHGTIVHAANPSAGVKKSSLHAMPIAAVVRVLPTAPADAPDTDEDAADVEPAPTSALAKAKTWAAQQLGATQYACLANIVRRESGWNVHAREPHTGAYGLGQAKPASKMASAGSDWRDNPRTQLAWTLGYIKARYGSPCTALGHHRAHGWY